MDSISAFLGLLGRVGANFRTGNTYSNIVASGSSRVHNGNVYYIVSSSSSGPAFPPTLPEEAWQHTVSHNLLQPTLKRKRDSTDLGIITPKSRERPSLEAVLDSLGHFSKSIMLRKEGEEGRKIAEQIRIVLDSLKQAGNGQPLSDDLETLVKDLSHRLERETRVKINAVTPRHHATRLSKANTTVVVMELGKWQVCLQTKTLKSPAGNGHLDIETCTSLQITPLHKSRGSPISIFFGQTTDMNRMTSIHPIVRAYNQVDPGSKVFRLVKVDDLTGLMALLATGEATTRDCDDEGRSLLYHACYHACPEICKFLVDNGADVDRIETGMDGIIFETQLKAACSHEKIHSLRAFPRYDWNHTEGLSRSLECRKLLLQRGADPTVPYTPDIPSESEPCPLSDSLGEAAGSGPKTYLDLILRESNMFFDIRSFRTEGFSLWLYACRSSAYLPTIGVLQSLIDAGALISENSEDGRNCLFHCALGAVDPNRSTEFESLRFLLTVFDDIFARDINGESIYDLVETRDEDFGSYRQDLWYCALHRSKLESRHDLPLPGQEPMFTEEYTPRHYRALLYLNTWEYQDVNPLTRDDLLSAKQKIQAPGFRDWDASTLLEMEQRAIGPSEVWDAEWEYYLYGTWEEERRTKKGHRK